MIIDVQLIVLCMLLYMVRGSISRQNVKVLSLIPAYSLNRFDPLVEMFREQQSMCEAGWDMELVIFTTVNVSVHTFEYLTNRLYCNRIKKPVPLFLSLHSPELKFNMVLEAKKYMREIWQRYDIIMYMEEDIIVTHGNVVSYLEQLEILENLLGSEIAYTEYYLGFQRYRRHLRSIEYNRMPMSDTDIVEYEYFEEIPFFRPICLGPNESHKDKDKDMDKNRKGQRNSGGGGGGSGNHVYGSNSHIRGNANVNTKLSQQYHMINRRSINSNYRDDNKNKNHNNLNRNHRQYTADRSEKNTTTPSRLPYLLVEGDKVVPPANVYQALWILTKAQIAALDKKCGWLDLDLTPPPNQYAGYVRESIGSLSLLANDLLSPSCGLKKIIPAERLIDFSVWHYYHSTSPQLFRRSHPVVTTQRHILSGMLQQNKPQVYAGYFKSQSCWLPIVTKYRSAHSPEMVDYYNRPILLQYPPGVFAVMKNGTKYPILLPTTITTTTTTTTTTVHSTTGTDTVGKGASDTADHVQPCVRESASHMRYKDALHEVLLKSGLEHLVLDPMSTYNAPTGARDAEASTATASPTSATITCNSTAADEPASMKHPMFHALPIGNVLA